MPGSTARPSAPPERAAAGEVTGAVERLLPALDEFLRFETPERTALGRSEWIARLEEPLPSEGAGTDAVLAELTDTVIPHGLRAGAPGFCGWVATGPATVPAATSLAAAVAGPLAVGIQSFNYLEALGLRWLAQLVGLPDTYQGIFTSGGSVANLIGLGAGRQHAAERRGLDPALDGMSGLPEPRIYVSDQVHHCMYRAAAVLGIGRANVVILPSDDELRMDVAALARQLDEDLGAGRTPVAVVANIGTIGSGAIDPLPELAALCREHDLWLHGDGAYGLFGVLDPEIADLYGDLTALDSVAVDPQKWLATTLGCGGVFVRDRDLLGRAFTLIPAPYVEDSQPAYADDQPVTSQFDDFGFAFHHFGVDHAPAPRGVEVWALLKEIGAEGVRDRVVRHNAFARHVADRVSQSPVLELMAPVTLSICCLRYVPEELAGREDPAAQETLNELNRQVLGLVRARGRAIPSATSIRGDFVIRPCFVNPRTELSDADALVDDVEECGAEAWAALRSG